MLTKKKLSESGYRILHGISGDNIRVIISRIGIEAIRKKADANVPLHHEVIAIVSSPNSGHSHSSFAVSLLKLKSIQFTCHDRTETD